MKTAMRGGENNVKTDVEYLLFFIIHFMRVCKKTGKLYLFFFFFFSFFRCARSC
jgi:hypothetical protein